MLASARIAGSRFASSSRPSVVSRSFPLKKNDTTQKGKKKQVLEISAFGKDEIADIAGDLLATDTPIDVAIFVDDFAVHT